MSSPRKINRTGQIVVGVCVALIVLWMVIQMTGVIDTNELFTILIPATLVAVAGLAMAWDYESNRRV